MSGPLFKPFRALGYITEDVPFAVQRRGKETYITVSVGRTWQIYNTAKLTLVMVGPQLSRSVSALACKGDLTFAAAGGAIHEAKRSTPTGIYAGHSGSIIQLLVLGDQLLSLGKDGQLLVWKIGEYEQPQVSISFEAPFTPTCFCHPDTYLNKVVVGGADGSMQLWNFVTGQMVHAFDGWGSPIKCLTSSPALDVVGVGLADGRAVLHNLRYDEEVCTLHNAAAAGTAAERFLTGSKAAAVAAASNAAVMCLSFRTGNGLPLLAAGGSAGVVALWNLEQRCLHHVVRDAHDAPLVGLHFFAGEPRLMSSGADNSIKQWVLDGQEAVPRLLKFRSGHSAPPVVVRHYSDGLRLLSAGADRSFRVFSTIQDQQSRELSQKNTAARAKKARVTQQELKLPRVTQLAACEARERDWANVITAHAGEAAAYTWRLAHFTLGQHVLLPPDAPQQQHLQAGPPVSAVGISCCGNFGLVGTEGGRVDRYNLQSGIHRGTYWRQQQQQQPGTADAAAPLRARNDTMVVVASDSIKGRSAGDLSLYLLYGADAAVPLPAHDGTVVGIASDSTNKLLVTAGSDGALRVWDFRKQKLRAELPLGSGATHLVLHPGSGLAAVACVDRTVRLVDIEAARVVRRFSGHSDRLTDIAISSDCRWLLTAGMDCTLRVWDIPASQCMQVMHMGTPVTSLSLSASQDLLATSHINKRGVFLWSNQLMFGDPSAVATYTEQPVPVHLPSIAAAAADGSEQQRKGSRRQQQQQKMKMKQHQQGSESESEQSESEGDGESSSEEDDEQQQQQRLLPGREVRLLIDGGVVSDSSDDFYGGSNSEGDSGSSSSSSDEDETAAAAGGASSSDGEELGANGLRGQQNGSQQPRSSLKKRRRAQQAAAAARATEAAAMAAAAYKQVDKTGAPAPLAPHLATLSLLPRSQWENLLHLDTIKARSKPLQPLKKPEAAPFFLPTVPTLAGHPTFDTDAAANGGTTAAAKAAGGGIMAVVDDVAHNFDDSDDDGGNAGSRVMRSRKGAASAAAAPSPFVALLRSSAAAGDFAGFMSHVRTLSPAALDRELRAMMILGPVDDPEDAQQQQEVADVGLLLEALLAELDAARNFEMVQALTSRVLTIHGDSLLTYPALRTPAERLQRKLRPVWLRLDDLLHNVRCMVDFVSNAQQA